MGALLRFYAALRVGASEALRASRTRDRQGLASEAAALEFVREVDRERAARIKFLYHVDVDDPLLYDVVVNTERASLADGVRIIRAALQGEFAQPSLKSLALARDVSIAAQAKARLLVDPATRGMRPAITAAAGRVTIAGTVDSDELRDRVIETTRGIPGVVDVIDELIVVRMAARYPTV